MADINATLMEQVFNVAKGQGEADIHYNRELDDLRRCLEVAKWRSGHEATLKRRGKALNLDSFDSTQFLPTGDSTPHHFDDIQLTKP